MHNPSCAGQQTRLHEPPDPHAWWASGAIGRYFWEAPRGGSEPARWEPLGALDLNSGVTTPRRDPDLQTAQSLTPREGMRRTAR